MITKISRIKGIGYLVSVKSLFSKWRFVKNIEDDSPHIFIDLQSAEEHIRAVWPNSWIKYVNC